MARSLKHIAFVVTIGTLLSKLGGLARQLIIAAAFGVGTVYEAYSYAYILPGFLLILLGGINGPFHSAMVSVLSRRPREERAYILATLTTLVGAVLLLVSIAMILFADSLISLLAPGIPNHVHRVAVVQLQIMSPISLLAGLIGLGFGSLNATNEFWIPAISPLMSSLTLTLAISGLWWQLGAAISQPSFALVSSVVLATATLIGAMMQWLLQIPVLIQHRLMWFRFSWNWQHLGVREVWHVMGPATLSSTVLQVNVFVDLFFASGILGAAAGLGYASLLVQMPVGLISNALLVPLLPALSRLISSTDCRPALINKIRQSLMLSTASTVPLGALFVVLGGPIVSLIYQRGAFNSAATELVTSLLIAYGIGMPAYLGRDVLVRIFYALGDGNTPLKLSLVGIGLNIFLDWFLVGQSLPWMWGTLSPLRFGAPGIILATVAVNCLTCLALLLVLHHKLGGLPLLSWLSDSICLLAAGLIGGLAAWSLSQKMIWPAGTPGYLLQISVSGVVGLTTYIAIAGMMGIPEMAVLALHFKRRPG